MKCFILSDFRKGNTLIELNPVEVEEHHTNKEEVKIFAAVVATYGGIVNDVKRENSLCALCNLLLTPFVYCIA
jgi:hypothetical protein